MTLVDVLKKVCVDPIVPSNALLRMCVVLKTTAKGTGKHIRTVILNSWSSLQSKPPAVPSITTPFRRATLAEANFDHPKLPPELP